MTVKVEIGGSIHNPNRSTGQQWQQATLPALISSCRDHHHRRQAALLV